MQPAANPITKQILRLNSTCVDYTLTPDLVDKKKGISINA